MIGKLPTKLKVNDNEYEIRTDYRDCLLILQAFSDVDLSDFEKSVVLIRCLYKNPELISKDNIQEALDKALWFINCGEISSRPKTQKKPVYDWEQDEQMIFSAINKVAGTEVRSIEYMHFWTFMGLFNEIGDGAFSTVVNIRSKKNKGKKLESYEQEFYRDNKHIVDLKKKRTIQEQAELEALEIFLKQ